MITDKVINEVFKVWVELNVTDVFLQEKIKTHTEERSCEERGRRWPTASQGKRVIPFLY